MVCGCVVCVVCEVCEVCVVCVVCGVLLVLLVVLCFTLRRRHWSHPRTTAVLFFLGLMADVESAIDEGS